MEKLLSFFPLNAKVKKDDVKSLIITILLYIAVSVVMSIVTWIIGSLPIIGIVIGILSTLVGLYVLVGIVLAIVTFVK